MEKKRVRDYIHPLGLNTTPDDVMPEDLQGWNSDSPTFKQCIDLIKPTRIYEVGTWKGASAIHMANTLLGNGVTDFEIVCIDTFLGSVEHWIDPHRIAWFTRHGRPTIYDQFISNIYHQKLHNYITPFPCDSINAGLTLSHWGLQADMIYIDAGHEYESVKADLELYKYLVRPGGIILGDDWYHGPIQRAVKEAFDGLGEVIILSHDKFMWKSPE